MTFSGCFFISSRHSLYCSSFQKLFIPFCFFISSNQSKNLSGVVVIFNLNISDRSLLCFRYSSLARAFSFLFKFSLRSLTNQSLSNFSIFGNHSHCIIKINEHEYQNVDDDLFDHEACELVVTLGKNGAWWMNENKYYQTNETSVFDVCGAGDTFLAGLVTAYLSSKQNMEESIIFANKCASFAVKKLGTYAIKKEDISGIM